MKRTLVILSQARAELYDQAEYLSIDNEDLSRRFLAAADATFADLFVTPGLGRVREFRAARLRGLRSWRIRGFENWLVFYRVTEETIEVVRVLHGVRDVDATLDKGGDA